MIVHIELSRVCHPPPPPKLESSLKFMAFTRQLSTNYSSCFGCTPLALITLGSGVLVHAGIQHFPEVLSSCTYYILPS